MTSKYCNNSLSEPTKPQLNVHIQFSCNVCITLHHICVSLINLMIFSSFYTVFTSPFNKHFSCIFGIKGRMVPLKRVYSVFSQWSNLLLQTFDPMILSIMSHFPAFTPDYSTILVIVTQCIIVSHQALNSFLASVVIVLFRIIFSIRVELLSIR